MKKKSASTKLMADKEKVGAMCSSGVEGLDDILSGGFTRNRLYLLEGVPGSGKTTLAMQFLLEGLRCDESVLYVTLSETKEELDQVAGSHGWSLEGIHIRELIPNESTLLPDDQYTMFHPSEVELSETTKEILSDVERVKPSRIVFDSLSELRLLAGSPIRYRRQILALKQFFAGRKCTVLLLDDMTSTGHDLQVQSLAHASIRLEQNFPEFGAERRRLIVSKYRGVAFRGGYHDYKIIHGGLEVYPRLVAGEHRLAPSRALVKSGVKELDELLGGGLDGGTSTLVVGAAGTGKSTLAAQFVTCAAKEGSRAAMFIFEESRHTLLTRTRGVGIELDEMEEKGLVTIQQIDPAELSPGEFIHAVRRAVEKDKISVLVIDSLNGYLNAMPDERFLIIQLHELLTYLGQKNVATLLVGAQHGLLGLGMHTPIDASYLADAVVLMRYYELRGEVRQAISIVKKRGGGHERTIRDFRLNDRTGIVVGPPLRDFRGVLTGVPIFEPDVGDQPE